MRIRAYLDNNATTRPDNAVLEAVRLYQEDLFLNAASTAGEILGADRPLAEARTAMLELLGGSLVGDRIALTSGATEANSWALLRGLAPSAHAIVSATEHSSILAACDAARSSGQHIDLIPVDENGLVDPEKIAALVREDTGLVSIQLANNETGVIQPLREIGTVIRKQAPQVLIHTDATQAVARIPIDLSGELADVDLLSFSAHKFHGPKGVGGLYLRDGVTITALIPGEQEGGLRGGTSNVPGAAGLAAAARKAHTDPAAMQRVAGLRDLLEAELLSMRPDARIHGQDAKRLPNTSSIAFPGVRAEDIVEQLALQGICIAAGSACTAGATAPSHVLTAMGVSQTDAQATLRFSLSACTSRSEIDLTLEALAPLLRTPTRF